MFLMKKQFIVIALIALQCNITYTVGMLAGNSRQTIMLQALKYRIQEHIYHASHKKAENKGPLSALKEIFSESAKDIADNIGYWLNPLAKKAYEDIKHWAGTIDLRKYSGEALKHMQKFCKYGAEKLSEAELLAVRGLLYGTKTLATGVAVGIAEEIGTRVIEDHPDIIQPGVNKNDVIAGTLITIVMNGIENVIASGTNALATLSAFIPL